MGTVAPRPRRRRAAVRPHPRRRGADRAIPAAGACRRINPLLVEVPAGFCDGNETPEQTIGREAHEEIGLGPGRSEPIGNFLLTAGGSDELCALFAGRVRDRRPDRMASPD